MLLRIRLEQRYIFPSRFCCTIDRTPLLSFLQRLPRVLSQNLPAVFPPELFLEIMKTSGARELALLSRSSPDLNGLARSELYRAVDDEDMAPSMVIGFLHAIILYPHLCRMVRSIVVRGESNESMEHIAEYTALLMNAIPLAKNLTTLRLPFVSAVELVSHWPWLSHTHIRFLGAPLMLSLVSSTIPDHHNPIIPSWISRQKDLVSLNLGGDPLLLLQGMNWKYRLDLPQLRSISGNPYTISKLLENNFASVEYITMDAISGTTRPVVFGADTDILSTITWVALKISISTASKSLSDMAHLLQHMVSVACLEIEVNDPVGEDTVQVRDITRSFSKYKEKRKHMLNHLYILLFWMRRFSISYPILQK